MARFAQVVVPSPVKNPLVYAIPSTLQDTLKSGMRVLVPLGKRKVTGITVEITTEANVPRVREIIDTLDAYPVLEADLLRFCEWVSKYYAATPGEVLTLMLPSVLRLESERDVVARREQAVSGGRMAKEIFATIQRAGKVSVKSLSRKFPAVGFYRTLNSLISSGAVEISERLKKNRSRGLPPHKNEVGGEEKSFPSYEKPILSEEQDRTLRAVRERVQNGGFETFLLFGVTGSGKTEVYLRAIELVQNLQKQSLILVPEISLTPQLLDRLRQRFPDVGILHSGLTPSERWLQWWRIVRGEVSVVIGARSAIFAPFSKLGLIVVDEEHDPSYKQEEGIRYHARDLAVVRGKITGCPVILGSATPAVESFENCRKGRYRLLELGQRFQKRPLPSIEIVDLRIGEAKTEKPGKLPTRDDELGLSRLISPLLREAIKENQKGGQQSLLFLNRRGFANFLQCRLCGFVIKCPHCSVTLTYHKNRGIITCHHCGFRKSPPNACPECSSTALLPVGVGTEKVEQEILRLFPSARVGRMDRDTTRRRGSQEDLFRKWEKGQIEILIGTQMITKGHDVTGVTLVGVLLADLSLNLPDFRASERTFQLLAQVAGRAGRGSLPGRVIVQTYNPEHYVFPCVLTHDYTKFFRSEIDFRRDLNYPPFSRLIQLRLDGLKSQRVESRAQELGNHLRRRLKQAGKKSGAVEILGPAPSPLERLRGRYRWQILLKGQSHSLVDLAAKAKEALSTSRDVRLHIDVDPYSML